MRNFNSSLIIWIGITLASLLWYYCHGYPHGMDYKHRNFLLQKRDVRSINIKEDNAATHSIYPLHYPTVEQSIHTAQNSEKRHVSITMKNLKTIKIRKIGNNFLIGDGLMQRI